MQVPKKPCSNFGLFHYLIIVLMTAVFQCRFCSRHSFCSLCLRPHYHQNCYCPDIACWKLLFSSPPLLLSLLLLFSVFSLHENAPSPVYPSSSVFSPIRQVKDSMSKKKNLICCRETLDFSLFPNFPVRASFDFPPLLSRMNKH